MRTWFFHPGAIMTSWLLWIVGPGTVEGLENVPSSGEGDRGAQRVALQLLADRRLVGVFPEGTRSRDGQLREGRAGATLLAIRTGVPVLPVGIAGTHRIFPGRSRWPHRSRVTIRVGKPFSLPLVPNGLDREALRQGTDRTMRAIAELLPPEQRGRWGMPAAD